MARPAGRTLLWAPRVLAIAYIAFLGVFALDVFEAGRGFGQTMLALMMHLIPSFVPAVVLVAAWRWEWIGAVFFGAAGLLYAAWAAFLPHGGLWP